ncbi:MAG: phage integrase SAM-like domain-containing protein [Dysgonomonadaceae bacterium]|jgi:hypothetical protein|nr:phage integrase SAM-like domain-containing protein [Dysgonamonadaceae bacterium]
MQIDKILLSLELDGVLLSLTDAQLRSYLSKDVLPAHTLRSVFREFIDTKHGNTKQLYDETMRKIADDPLLDDITVTWLQRFYDSMDLAVNTKAIHMRNIRAVINFRNRQRIYPELPFQKIQNTQRKN